MGEQPHSIQLKKYGTDEFVTVAGKSDPAEKPPLRNYDAMMSAGEQATPQASLMRRVGRWLQEHAPGAVEAATPQSVPEPRDVIFLKNYETHEIMAIAVKPKHEAKTTLRDYSVVMAERAQAAAQQPSSSMKKLGEWLETNAPDAPAATPKKPLGQYRA